MSVLVLLLSEGCPACIQFKKNILPTIKKELENDSRFRFIILEFPTMAVPAPKSNEYHPELRNFVGWFPTLLLFPSNLWNNSKSKLRGLSKHGDEKNPIEMVEKADWSKTSIFSWINETLKKPLFSNVILIDNSKNLGGMAKVENGKYSVPTYGTYTKFTKSRPEESQFYN